MKENNVQLMHHKKAIGLKKDNMFENMSTEETEKT